MERACRNADGRCRREKARGICLARGRMESLSPGCNRQLIVTENTGIYGIGTTFDYFRLRFDYPREVHTGKCSTTAGTWHRHRDPSETETDRLETFKCTSCSRLARAHLGITAATQTSPRTKHGSSTCTTIDPRAIHHTVPRRARAEPPSIHGQPTTNYPPPSSRTGLYWTLWLYGGCDAAMEACRVPLAPLFLIACHPSHLAVDCADPTAECLLAPSIPPRSSSGIRPHRDPTPSRPWRRWSSSS